jgi:hypothetical protein
MRVFVAGATGAIARQLSAGQAGIMMMTEPTRAGGRDSQRHD